MRPALSVLDRRDGSECHAIRYSDKPHAELSASKFFSDGMNVARSQLGLAVLDARDFCPVSFSVGKIAAVRIPPKIVKTIVRSVSVVVGCTHAMRFWAYKRFKNKAMHQKVGLSIVHAKPNLHVTTTISFGDKKLAWDKPPSIPGFNKSLKRTYSTKAGNGVLPFVSAHGIPFFIHRQHHIKQTGGCN
jgi:hypothetical protein